MRIGLEPFAIVDETGEDDDAQHQEKDEQRQFFSRCFKRVNLSPINSSVASGKQTKEDNGLRDTYLFKERKRNKKQKTKERNSYENLETGRMSSQFEESQDADDGEELKYVRIIHMVGQLLNV